MVWRVEHFAEIDSTNTRAVLRARDGEPEGLVVVAEYQSTGRGRLDRTWDSTPGASLLCSILLRPSIDVDHLQVVVTTVALSARAALVRLSGVRPRLKWPNDLIVGDAKIAGLLAEAVTTNDGLAVVVGIGVNLTSAPDGVNATSVREQSGVTLVPIGLLDIMLEEIEHRIEAWVDDEGHRRLRAEYEGALATIGERVRVETHTEVFEGVAQRVDLVGRLVVDVDGTAMTFSSGDVVHLRPMERGDR